MSEENNTLGIGPAGRPNIVGQWMEAEVFSIVIHRPTSCEIVDLFLETRDSTVSLGTNLLTIRSSGFVRGLDHTLFNPPGQHSASPRHLPTTV